MIYFFCGAQEQDLYDFVQRTEFVGARLDFPKRFLEGYNHFIQHPQRDENPFVFLNFLTILKECSFPREDRFYLLNPDFDFSNPEENFDIWAAIFDTDTHNIKNLIRGFLCSSLDFWRPWIKKNISFADCTNALYNLEKDPWNCVNIAVFLMIFTQPFDSNNPLSLRIESYKSLNKKTFLMNAALLVLINKNDVYVNIGLNVLCLFMTNFYNKLSVLIRFCADLFGSEESKEMMCFFVEKFRRERR